MRARWRTSDPSKNMRQACTHGIAINVALNPASNARSLFESQTVKFLAARISHEWRLCAENPCANARRRGVDDLDDHFAKRANPIGLSPQPKSPIPKQSWVKSHYSQRRRKIAQEEYIFLCHGRKRPSPCPRVLPRRPRLFKSLKTARWCLELPTRELFTVSTNARVQCLRWFTFSPKGHTSKIEPNFLQQRSTTNHRSRDSYTPVKPNPEQPADSYPDQLKTTQGTPVMKRYTHLFFGGGGGMAIYCCTSDFCTVDYS